MRRDGWSASPDSTASRDAGADQTSGHHASENTPLPRRTSRMVPATRGATRPSSSPQPASTSSGGGERSARLKSWSLPCAQNTFNPAAGQASAGFPCSRCVNRELRGLRLADDLKTLPARGDKLFKDGKEIGYITSAIASPMLKANIALGYVRREA